MVSVDCSSGRRVLSDRAFDALVFFGAPKPLDPFTRLYLQAEEILIMAKKTTKKKTSKKSGKKTSKKK